MVGDQILIVSLCLAGGLRQRHEAAAEQGGQGRRREELRGTAAAAAAGRTQRDQLEEERATLPKISTLPRSCPFEFPANSRYFASFSRSFAPFSGNGLKHRFRRPATAVGVVAAPGQRHPEAELRLRRREGGGGGGRLLRKVRREGHGQSQCAEEGGLDQVQGGHPIHNSVSEMFLISLRILPRFSFE